MDVTEPPRIVWESSGPCEGSAHFEPVVRAALATVGPTPAARIVRVRVSSTGGRGVRAEAEIGDPEGVSAHRTLSDASGDCEGLARAIAVWAALVLDEDTHSSDGSRPAARAAPRAAEEPKSGGKNGGAESSAPASAASDGRNGRGPEIGIADGHPELTWPAPVVNEAPPPEHDWYLHHDEDRTFEIGLGALLVAGTSSTTMAGASPYTMIEAGSGVFLRPSLAVAQSVTALSSAGEARATWAAARFDACLRLPGLYTRHHGLQLDPCAGVDVGLTRFGAAPSGSAGAPTAVTLLPYASVGPSIELRGELGGSLSAAVRGVGGINLIRASYLDGDGTRIYEPLWSTRIEVALSWRLR